MTTLERTLRWFRNRWWVVAGFFVVGGILIAGQVADAVKSMRGDSPSKQSFSAYAFGRDVSRHLARYDITLGLVPDEHRSKVNAGVRADLQALQTFATRSAIPIELVDIFDNELIARDGDTLSAAHVTINELRKQIVTTPRVHFRDAFALGQQMQTLFLHMRQLDGTTRERLSWFVNSPDSERKSVDAFDNLLSSLGLRVRFPSLDLDPDEFVSELNAMEVRFQEVWEN